MKKVFLLLILSSISLLSYTQDIDKAAIDKIFSEWDTPTSPGCALGVFMDGKLAYGKGYGQANLEYDIPNDANSVFRIGSTSKQFTAACIVLLAERGELSLDNTLDQYFPDFPTYAKRITVRHLLNHTSGIRDYLMLAYLKGLRDDDYYEDADLMRWLVNQEDLNFEPGAEFLYSNSGYWLLGQIVKEVAGMNMAEYAEKEIFQPLGMSNTHFHNDHGRIVPNRASGYRPAGEDSYAISMTTLNMIGDGGIFTSINDIKKWDDAYYDRSVLSDTFWSMMTEQGVLNDGEKIAYAAGLFIDEYNDLPTISHGGAFVGFRAELLRFPEQHVSIAIFANRADANPSQLAEQVADVVLLDLFVDVDEPEEEVPVVAAVVNTDVEAYALEQLTGNYEVEPGVVVEISIQKDSLHVFQTWNNSAYNLGHVGGNSFKIPGEESVIFSFRELKEGQTQEMLVDQAGDVTVCTRKKEVDLSAVDITDYAGNYYSKELDEVYYLKMDGDALKVQVRQNAPLILAIGDVDQLTVRGFLLRFQREDGQITGFELDAGRVKNLRFERQ